jgi:hypothetical protein
MSLQVGWNVRLLRTYKLKSREMGRMGKKAKESDVDFSKELLLERENNVFLEVLSRECVRKVMNIEHRIVILSKVMKS